MDSTTQIQKLAGAVREFCRDRDWDQFHTAKDLAIGLVTEASELLAEFRFLNADQCRAALVQPESRERVGHELADILFFLLRFSDLYGFDLDAEMKKKMALNEVKYPADKFRGRNHKYNREPVE